MMTFYLCTLFANTFMNPIYFSIVDATISYPYMAGQYFTDDLKADYEVAGVGTG